MARLVANVDIITDSFEVWLLQTNELLNAFSTEIITANTTTANTGNSTISRTAQLWGTFGANTIAVSTALRGGNVATGNSANLVITSNVTAYVAADAGIRVLVGNSTSNSFLSPIGVHLGLGSANTFANSTAIITQSSAIVNTNISPTLIQIANSTSTANITPIAFRTGIFTGNTTVMSIGANVYANATTLYVGNSTFDSAFGNGSWTGVANLVITPTNYLTIAGAANVVSNANFANTVAVTGNATLSNTLSVTGNTTLANTLAVTGNTTLANTLAVTGATTLSNTLNVTGLTTAAGNLNTPTANASVAVNVGANVNLTLARFNIGNSSVNTAITSTAIDTDGTLDVLGATALANTLAITGLTTASGNLNTPTANASVDMNIGANVNLTTSRFNVGNSSVNTFITATAIETDGTLTVLGVSTLANTLDVAGLASLNAALNTTTANASVAVNVGANVNLTTSRFNVGNSTVNTFITSTAIETDGTLTVLGATSLANTLAVTGNTTLSNTLAVTGAANLASTLGVVGAVALSNTIAVTGNATFSNTISVTGLTTLSGAMNTTTANASVAVNIGANVNISTSTLTMGDPTLATNTCGTYTRNGITLNDAVSEASNTFSVSFTPTRYRNQKQYVNATVTVRDVIDLSRTEFYIVEREAVFAGDGGAANNLGKIYANTTVLRVSNTTVNSEISTGEVRVGANVNLTTSRFNVGNSTVNTFITSTAIETDGTLTVFGATSLANTLAVTGNTTLSNTLSVTGLTTLSGAMNTTTANASVAVNIGANVNLTTTRVNVGNSTVNTFITSTAIETDGTLTVLGATSLANTLAVTGNVTFSNTLSVTGAANVLSTFGVGGATTLAGSLTVGGATTFQTDYVVDVSANADIGSTVGAVLIYRFTKATYASGKFEVQVKNGNTQLSELVLAHDGGSNAFVTTYGTVASNGGASPLGTFTANTDTANVNLYLVQTVANSAVKVVAHLIK